MSIKQIEDKYLKNLKYQIQVESMGLNSWGSVKPRKTTQAFELPSSDKLLNNKNELLNKQLARQQQIQLYLEKEKQPVNIDGTEYKYNNITEPTIEDLEPLKQHIEDLKNDLSQLENELEETNKYIRELTITKEKFKEDMENLDFIKNPPYPKNLFIKEYKRISDIYKNLLRDSDDLNVIIEERKNQLNTAISDYKQMEKENKKTIDDYAEELKRLNSGSFNIEKLYGETDEEYLQRMTTNSQIPFDNSTTKTLSDIERNNIFKDNLKMLFQSDAFIEQILNYFKTTNDNYIFTLNQYFNLFKDDYLKTYGYDNKTISQEKFIEIVNNFCGSRLSPNGEPDLITPSKEIEIKQKILFIGGPKNIPNLTLVGEQQEPGKETEEQKGEETGVDMGNKIRIVTELIDDNKTLHIKKVSKSGTKNLYVRYIEQYFTQGKNKEGKIFQFDNPKSGLIILGSGTNEEGSFMELSQDSKLRNSIYNVILKSYLSLDNKQIKELLDQKDPSYRVDEKGLRKFIEEYGIEKTEIMGIPLIVNESKQSQHPKIGMGIKNDIPQYIEFGKYVLLLKKLFLKNILSIQKKNHQKVPGFKNYNVSDEFVNMIMKLYKDNQSITIKDLSSLKIGEKELLDNLLSMCELNKKIITGSGQETMKKIKEDLKLIEGQIEAGNNNPIMKDELYKTLFKLVNFGAITEKQARTHYKNICNDFFV